MTNDKLREALLPCPFCGGEARFYSVGDDCTVECDQCDVSTRVYLYAHEAISAWNDRVAAPVEAEPVAQVTLTMPEATALLDCYGGEEADITVRHFAATVDEETGEPMPAGYYAIFADYPEEGRLYLDPAHPAEQGKDAEDAIPREPTEAMLIAGCDAHYRTSTMDHVGPVLAKCWRAMYDAVRNAKPAKGG